MQKPEWTLTESAEYIGQIIDHAICCGCYLGLTGGNLFKGYSDKDLDIIVYPAKTNEEYSFENFRKFLPNVLSWHDTKSKKAEDITSSGGQPNDNKIVWKAKLANGKTIDFFFLK